MTVVRRLGRGLSRRARAAATALRRPATAVVAVACLIVFALFAFNHDMGGDPDSPRGDGRYRPVLARGDGHMMYLMARSTVLDGDWRFDNDLARFGDPWNQPRTPTGRKGIPHPIGPPLVWTPVLAVAHGGAKLVNLFGADVPSHGYTAWHQRIVFFTSVVFGCGAVLLGLGLARRVIGGTWAPSYAAVAVLLGTSLTYYASIMPSYGHAMDAFFCAAFLGYWAATVGRDDLRRHVVLGALLGVAALIRIQELAMGVALAVEIATRALAAVRDRDAAAAARLRRVAGLIGRGALTLAVALICFTPQLAAWRIVDGSYGLPHGQAYTRWGTPMIAELLWSARNGWLVVTPVAYLAVVGLLMVPARHRLIGAGLIAAVAVQVYLNSTIMDWWGQASFGQRRLCSVTLPLVVGLAALLSSLGRLAARRPRVPRAVWHGLALVVLVPMVAWNVDRVWALHGGKPAPTVHSPSCCKRVPKLVRRPVEALYRTIGNPFELPASAVYALWHDTSLARWDQTVGDYPIILDGQRMANGTWRQQRGTWNLAGDGGAPYLLEGFGPSHRGPRPYRWTTARRARALVPNLIPAGQRFAVWLAPGGARHVTLRYQGARVAEVDLADGWQQVSFDVADPPVGSNELVIEAEPGPVAPGGPLVAPATAAGVAVGTVELSFL